MIFFFNERSAIRDSLHLPDVLGALAHWCFEKDTPLVSSHPKSNTPTGTIPT